MCWDKGEPADANVRRLDHETAELALLLPACQVAALEQLARARGVSVGCLVRRLVGDYLTNGLRDAGSRRPCGHCH